VRAARRTALILSPRLAVTGVPPRLARAARWPAVARGGAGGQAGAAVQRTAARRHVLQGTFASVLIHSCHS
jgi:hypothetical protein